MTDATGAAMVVVPADWSAGDAIGLSQAAHDRWFDSLFSGQRVLIYAASPVDAIVAEGEVHDQLMVRLDDWPSANVKERVMTGVGTPADYVLPLRILYTRVSVKQVPLERILDRIDEPEFPNVEWVPLLPEQYKAFANWP